MLTEAEPGYDSSWQTLETRNLANNNKYTTYKPSDITKTSQPPRLYTVHVLHIVHVLHSVHVHVQALLKYDYWILLHYYSLHHMVQQSAGYFDHSPVIALCRREGEWVLPYY